jgi:hypothetical protein
MVIELDRDPAFKVVSQLQYCPDREDIMYPFRAYVPFPPLSQWHQSPLHPTLDGFTIRRTGDTPTKVRLILHLQQYLEQLRVLRVLCKTYMSAVFASSC